MERRIINPGTWQDQFGFAQAVEASGAHRILFCALDNLETLLGQAGFKLADVVRLQIFTTDMDAFLTVFPALQARLDQAECRCAQTLIGVVRLAAPTLMVEVEAIAAQ